jgi:nitrogen regulatory protein P-II 2
VITQTRRETQLKLITAIIKPFKLDDVRQSLQNAGVVGVTVTEVKGYGRQKGTIELYRGAEYVVSFVPKLQLEIAAKDDDVDQIVHVILDGARTGRVGDGKIFVASIEHAVRIRTGETGEDALQ